MITNYGYKIKEVKLNYNNENLDIEFKMKNPTHDVLESETAYFIFDSELKRVILDNKNFDFN